jgi:hypothetical protein
MNLFKVKEEVKVTKEELLKLSGETNHLQEFFETQKEFRENLDFLKSFFSNLGLVGQESFSILYANDREIWGATRDYYYYPSENTIKEICGFSSYNLTTKQEMLTFNSDFKCILQYLKKKYIKGESE